MAFRNRYYVRDEKGYSRVVDQDGRHLWTVKQGRNPRLRSSGCSNPNFNNYLTGSWISCRKCDFCKWVKMKDWVSRALVEIKTFDKTWFVTLTFRHVPEKPYPEIQKWLKKIRKDYHGKLKYLCTTEHGSLNGRLHYHLLVHGDQSLTKAIVRSNWSNGISEAKLVARTPVQNAEGTQSTSTSELKAARYVCKYIMKENQKIRASQHYGIPF